MRGLRPLTVGSNKRMVARTVEPARGIPARQTNWSKDLVDILYGGCIGIAGRL